MVDGGSDVLDGGNGVDAVDALTARTNASVTVDLARGLSGIGGPDSLVDIEDIYGTTRGDFLYGDDGPNVIFARSRNDFVIGHGGDDRIHLGPGK
jgi:serralysin